MILIPQARVLVSGEAIGFAGLVPKMESWPDCHLFNMRFDPPTAMVKAVQKTSDLVRLHGVTLKNLITGNVSLRSLGGPIAVAKEAGATAKYGLVYFLLFIALISTNLGVINLLPIPLLDGGHLLFLIIELVFRRSLPKKVQEWGLRVGGAIVFSLMASAILNDLTRL